MWVVLWEKWERLDTRCREQSRKSVVFLMASSLGAIFAPMPFNEPLTVDVYESIWGNWLYPLKLVRRLVWFFLSDPTAEPLHHLRCLPPFHATTEDKYLCHQDWTSVNDGEEPGHVTTLTLEDQASTWPPCHCLMPGMTRDAKRRGEGSTEIHSFSP